MKKVIYLGLRMSFMRACLLLLLSFSFTLSVQAQAIPPDTYLSTFPDPTGKYTVTQPTNCTVGVIVPQATTPADITSPANVSSATLTDFATLSTGLKLGVNCSGQYRLIANLNLGGLSEVPASVSNPYNAGFKISIGTLLDLSLLGNPITIVTYLNGAPQQSLAPSLTGINLLTADPINASITATMPFNQVAVQISSGLLTLSLPTTVNFYYAFASKSILPILLPVKLTSFSATIENKNVAVNWTTASEINVAKYELQRSSDGGITFNTITTVAAKGSAASETKYSYADGTALTGNYTYRLKMIDKDGGAEYSKLVSVKLTSNVKWKVYPTLLTSGTDLNVSFATAGTAKTQVQLANLQGQVVRTVSTGANNKLTINTSGLSGGVYVLKLYKEGELQTSEKIIIQ